MGSNNCLLIDLLGKHVTVISLASNQPVTPDATLGLFSGKLERIAHDEILIRLNDGTAGVFFKRNLIGLAENKVVDD